MLTLHDIRKDYGADADTVHALRGVTLHFRPHEFVAILGPSGCGKTTLLNIIGGLDHYTAGDLVIGGVSTKEYRDRDWDTYRNHRVGFIFQSYNLIPHQSVLANVELALTLSGVSRAERRIRATDALARVGLSDQIRKKPGQMSGGQMQRVAIARALVNDPEIVLADEPTGALDTATSEQIMQILSEIASRKLIVMVTHNPDLAERYATRIIRVLDGQVVSDSNPYDGFSEEGTAGMPSLSDGAADAAAETEAAAVAASAEPGAERENLAAASGVPGSGAPTVKPKKEKKAKRAKKKTSMSFLTALSLSLNNLMTKKTRTFLTAFAGSIGIIGIALILALSNGISLFIDKVQEDTLSSYPVEVTRETMDLSAMLSAFSGAGNDDFQPEDGYIYSNDQLTDFADAMRKGYRENDLVAFRKYIESDASHLREHATVQYKYSVTPQIYYQKQDGNYLAVNPSEVMTALLKYFGMSGSSMTMNAWSEMIDNRELLESQYSVLSGHWPEKYDEVVLVADKNHQISDLVLYALGLKDPAELTKMLAGGEVEATGKKWTFDELLNLKYRCIIPADYYKFDSDTGTYLDLRKTDGSGNALTHVINDRGIEVKVVGIVAANPDATATAMDGAIGYTSALTRYVIDRATAKDENGDDLYPVIAAQLADPKTDAITGKPFYEPDQSTDEQKAQYLLDWLNSDATADSDVAAQYAENLAAILLEEMVERNLLLAREMESGARKEEVRSMLADEPTLLNRIKREFARSEYAASAEAIANVDEEQLLALMDTQLSSLIYGFVKTFSRHAYDDELDVRQKTLSAMDDASKARDYRAYVQGKRQQTQASLWDIYQKSTTSESTYQDNCRLLGITNVDDPTAIYLYPKSFDDKDAISREIDAYNATEGNTEITYTDYIGIMLNSVSTILNVITYVLVAFVGISLVVSSIMIGIITYISVLERIKEIGILRAIGASKRDVSHVFLAETLIVGFIAGMLGILVTLILTVPVNMIIRSLSGFASIGARLPFLGAVVLVLISMALTLVAGLIPAKIAAKKEPVVALRSE